MTIHYSPEVTFGNILQIFLILLSVVLVYAQLRQEIALLKQALSHVSGRLSNIEETCKRGCPFTRTAALVAAAGLALSAGCSQLVPRETRTTRNLDATTDNAARFHGEFTRALSDQSPPITITTSGTNNPVTLHVQPHDATTTAHQDTSAAAAATSRTLLQAASSIPLGVKLILVALGGFMLLLLVWTLRRASAAASAAYAAADSTLARLIDRQADRAASSTNAAAIAQALADRSAIEKERGKLAATRNA